MAIYKDCKRNTWFFRVYVFENGVKKQKCRSGFETKSRAREEERAFLNYYYSLNERKNFHNIKFGELYEEYSKNKSQNLKPQSYRALSSRFKNYILPFFKDYYICDIDNKVYINWKQMILDHNFSYKYNSSLHGCMVNILNYAIDFYDLDKNIASKVGNFSRKDYFPKVDYWSLEEFQKFISVVNDNVYRTLFHVLYFTGLRLGECLALNWNDFKNDYLIINKTLAKGKINGNYVITSPKTFSSRREIKLDFMTIDLLNQLKEFYMNFVGFSNDWFIFGGLCALSQTTIGRKKNEFCNLSNVKKIRIHDFRHSHATFLLSHGIPITVISKRLGHKDVSMTLNVYSHFIPKDEDKAILLINSLDIKE